MRALLPAILACAALFSDPAASAEAPDLSDWRYDRLYAEGISVRDLLSGTPARSADAERFGEVEDLLVAPDGTVLAVVVALDGVGELGAEAIAVPWDRVFRVEGEDSLGLPVTEEMAGDYSRFGHDYPEQEGLDRELDDGGLRGSPFVLRPEEAAPRGTWRASRLIGSPARLAATGHRENYGEVRDLVVRDDKVAAVVVASGAASGPAGDRAFPFQAGAWTPAGSYDLPYGREQVARVPPFDYDRLELD